MGSRRVRVLFLALLSVPIASAVGAQSRADAPIRVGVVAYQTWGAPVQAIERYFARVSATGPSVDLTLGTYDEVLHWFRKGWIDAAVVTPGVYAQMLALRDRGGDVPSFRYLGTRGPRPSYASLAVVRRDSAVRSLADLAQIRSELLFVHRLSAAGRIVPLQALAALGISDFEEKFTFSHSESLRRLLESPEGSTRVAFVWDGALDADALPPKDRARLRVLGSTPLPDGNPIAIPEDALIVRTAKTMPEFELGVAAANQAFSDYGFEPIPDQENAYRRLLANEPAARGDPNASHFSLDEIGWMLRGYRESHANQEPRVALVLSGGGAKCAYQVGVLRALESELAQWGVDIDLVVGTSGGAINAVPAAMGMFATPEGRSRVERLWRGLDQRDIVRVSRGGRLIHGIWVALVGYALASFLARRLGGQSQPLLLGASLVALGAATLWIGYSAWSPWAWLGENHTLHHLFLFASVGAHWSGWTLSLLGIGRLIRGRRPAWIRPESRSARFGRVALFVGILGLPPIQTINLLFFQETLITEESMERMVAEGYAELLGERMARNIPAREQIRRYSAKIVDGNLLKRDLVITASGLDGVPDGLVSDLYFYAAADEGLPHYGPRQGVSLRNPRHPGLLLDVVMGSASIYPLFPAREVRDFPAPGQAIYLVDGGFAHNSPVEAAVAWGATHVLVVEATPQDSRGTRGFLLRNALEAVDHLHRQAQLIDARSKERVVVLTIAPEHPHIDVLDFSDNLIETTIQKGEREALSGSGGRAGPSPFRRELGRPSFWTPGL